MTLLLPAPPVVSPPAVCPTPLAALLDRQAGVVSRAQALAAGLAPDAVDRYVARRRWRPLHPQVYLVAGHPLTGEARVRAAALWAGEGAVVVGAAALWWHGGWWPGGGARAPATVAVAVPHRPPAPRPGVTARRRVLPPADVVRVRGLAVTVRPLALLDAAVDAGPAGAALLRRALRPGAPADGARVAPARLRAAAGSAAGTASALRLVAGPAGGAGAARASPVRGRRPERPGT